MSNRSPPVQRRATTSAVTVDRSPRAGVLKPAVIVIVLAAVAGGVLRVADPGLLDAPLLHEARQAVDRLLADDPVIAVTPRASAVSDGSEPAPLERLHAAVASADRDTAVTLLKTIPREELDTPLGGMTALMRAASAGHRGMVRRLLRAGADPNARGAQQRTALQYAAEKNRMKVARALLDAGADIDGVDSGSLSPLVMAADRGFTDFALMLIERGANVNIQNVNGWTALMDAAEIGDRPLVEALLAAGAEPGARHHNGWTALDFARNGQHLDVVALLSPDGEPVQRRSTARPATVSADTPGPAAQRAGPPAVSSAPSTALPPRKGTRQ